MSEDNKLVVYRAVRNTKYRDWSYGSLGTFKNKSDAKEAIEKCAIKDAHMSSGYDMDRAKTWDNGKISFSNDDVWYEFYISTVEIN